MRGLPSISAAIALVSAPFFIPLAAIAAPTQQQSSPAENRQLQAFCYELIASGTYPTLSLGECMSFNSTSGSGYKTHVCDLFLETGTLGDEGFSSYSDCVRNVSF